MKVFFFYYYYYLARSLQCVPQEISASSGPRVNDVQQLGLKSHHGIGSKQQLAQFFTSATNALVVGIISVVHHKIVIIIVNMSFPLSDTAARKAWWGKRGRRPLRLSRSDRRTL